MSALPEIAVCGVLVHTRTEMLNSVRSALLSYSGVEVHQVTADGRLVVTVEGDNASKVGDTVMKLHNLDGVLSAAMVYQHCEQDTNLVQETTI